MAETDNPVHESKFKRGLALTRSALRTLRLDKRLVSVAAVSVAVYFILGVAFYLIVTRGGYVHQAYGTTYYSGWGLVAFVAYMLVAVIIINLFMSMIIFAANELFHGRTPTLRDCARAVRSRLAPLLLYSLFMATVGIIISLLIQRLPFGGKVVAWLAGVGWTVANFFSLPVIMLDTVRILNPLDVTKRSVGIIRKVWGEGVIANTGVAALMIVPFLAFFVLFIGGVILDTTVLAGNPTFFLAYGGVLFVLYLGVVSVSWTLNAIITAALYYYAQTGTAPTFFPDRSLRDAIGPKKSLLKS